MNRYLLVCLSDCIVLFLRLFLTWGMTWGSLSSLFSAQYKLFWATSDSQENTRMKSPAESQWIFFSVWHNEFLDWNTYGLSKGLHLERDRERERVMIHESWSYTSFQINLLSQWCDIPAPILSLVFVWLRLKKSIMKDITRFQLVVSRCLPAFR
jgi:hypothetical protein